MQELLEQRVKELIYYRLQRSKEDIKAAETMIKYNSYEAANNRIYYAVFHAILAVQSNDNIKSKRHGQIIGEFNKNYVKNNIFSKNIGSKIKDIQNVRHSSDYDDFYIANKSETKENLKSAKDILNEIEKFIAKKYNVKIENYQR